MSGHLHPDFADLLAVFVEEDVRFLLVGAFALAAHGVVRASGDMGVWVRPDAENATRVWNALVRFGAPVEQHEVRESDFAQPGVVYQMGVPPTRIDILTRIDGVEFDEAWAGRVDARVGDLALSFLGLRELLRNKRAAGRPKDLQDIELLREAGVAVDER